MGRRQEQRIAISLLVVVRGVDSKGTPFELSAVTRDISCAGACIESPVGPLQAGKKIEIQCRNQRAWYRVQWIVEGADSKVGYVGLRCLEPGKFIWGVTPPEWEEDTYDPTAHQAAAPPPSAPSPSAVALQPGIQERRQFPRFACRIEAQVVAHDRSVRLAGKITDIALGGCYLEMLTPLPVDCPVELTFGPREAPLQVTGTVRSSHTGMGMGVMFTGMSPGDFERLRQLTMPAEPSAKNVATTARSAPTSNTDARVSTKITWTDPVPADAMDSSDVRETLAAVVRILCRKQLLTRTEILEEVGKLKPTHT